ncbi:MAG: hypothetical protein FWC75_07325 [Oscillospiraceae bacterium]|nr:hypothetical protein [Oscillospiraceae bacterium]
MNVKAKVKEILKVAGASALVLALFGGAFVGTTHMAFAQATGTATPLTPAETPAAVSATAQPLPIGQRNFHVEKVTNWFGFEVGEVGANSISMEDAAEIGIGYLERFFEVDLEGKTVHMIYFGVEEPRDLGPNTMMLGGWRDRGDWRGIILPTGATINDSFGNLHFEINGATGEILSIDRNLSAATVFARGMSMAEGLILESRLIFETNPDVEVTDRGAAFLREGAPLGASVEGIFDPFTTEDSIVYANYAMQIVERLGILDGEIARARVMLTTTSARRVLNSDLELSAIIMAHVQCVDGQDAVIAFTMEEQVLTYLDFGIHLYFPHTVGGNDEHGNPIETTTTMKPQPTNFDWVSR